MNTQMHPWIERKIATTIFEEVVTGTDAVVYFIQAPAGMGKTFLARDIGVRLGSATGYEPGTCGNVVWSGILDLYDPDTNSNQGIERRLITAFSSTGFEFEAYYEARSLYDAWYKGGISGAGLEEQRRKVEEAFSVGLNGIAQQKRVVLAFDTIERLESALDPLQQEQPDADTAAVMDWLIYQISQLKNGVVLLFGRRASRFYQKLQEALDESKQIKPVTLDVLDAEEAQAFFARRLQRYPQLKALLDENLKALLLTRTQGKPLLLDLALLSLVESQNPLSIRRALEGPESLQTVERALLAAYLNASANPERQTLLRHLALARNGLFAELLEDLEPESANSLIAELRSMEALPFIKVRDISVAAPGRQERASRRTYFLHDAMYTLCDALWLKPEQVIGESQRLVAWYDAQLKAHLDSDLLVESLFYRMRADPVTGYQWYLQQSDDAIRGAHAGLDMRLRDAMGLFLASAYPDASKNSGQSLSSPIDQANIKTRMPELFDDYRLDSAILWVKRYTLRGKTAQAVKIGEPETEGEKSKARVKPWIEDLYKYNPERYRLPFAEFLLWYGQAMMYGEKTDQALKLYQRVIEMLAALLPPGKSWEDTLAGLEDFERWRLSLVLGRTYNNLGYTHWMYKGQYHLALKEFQQAVGLFRIANLQEERANTNDSMGRAHALLGNESQALELIRKGLKVRSDLGLTYRHALSANSLALALIRFGRADQALKTAEMALTYFRRAEVQRGIGLGLLTRGMIYRTLAEMRDEQGFSNEEALRYTEWAETDLKEAVRIFSTTVHEPIREVQARNEMACCYRARYPLLHDKESERQMAFTQGRIYFRQAITLAQTQGYVAEELDSMQDLAVLFMRAGQYADVRRYLEQIRSQIPDEYTIKPGIGLKELAETEQVDAYYKLLGQVELLEGALTYEEGKQLAHEGGASEDQPTREAWLETARHYLLAISYFNRYATESYALNLTFGRIYKRFEKCDPELVREITDVHLSRWVKEYNLPEELVRSLFQDVFGLIA